MEKRLLSLLLAFCFVFSLLPISAMAEETTANGSCGENVTWSLSGDVLVISGEGEMDNYEDGGAPWYDLADKIYSIMVEDGVTSIGSYAFKDLKHAIDATVADSVTSIGDYAFSDCDDLQSVALPIEAVSIGQYAFFNCWYLSSASIPNGVSTIRDSTFASCSNLVTVDIPETVTEVESAAFNVCDSLQDVNYSGTRAQWEEIIIGDCNIPLTSAAIHCSDDNSNVGGSCGDNLTWTLVDGTLTISGMGDMESYNSEEVPPWDYYRDRITDIVIEEGVTSIGDYAFRECENLQSVAISDSVTSIGMSAFSNCSALESIVIPSGVKVICSDAFSETALSDVTLSDGIERIEGYAFRNCYSLNSITIPSSVEDVSELAFRGCSNLSEIIVDESNETYSSLDGVLFNKAQTELVLYPEGKTDETYTVPDGVTTIKIGAFESNHYLEGVTLPDSVTELEQAAFASCYALKSIELPEGITHISIAAFQSCSCLESVTIPSSVTSIYVNAFEGCSSLSTVIFTGTVEQWGSIEIDDGNEVLNVATIRCTDADVLPHGKCGDDLTWMLDGDTLTISGMGDMYDYGWGNAGLGDAPWHGSASSILTIEIEDGVQSIGRYAFDDCISLTSIDIPNSIKSIGPNSFMNCGSLESVTIPDGVESIGEFAFNYCTNLTSVSIPSSVTSIGMGAFSWCNSLTDVTIADGVQDIGVGAFLGCAKLSGIVIPSSVTSIGKEAFYDCTGLESVDIPNSVRSISYMAFENCTSLKSVTLPDSVESIDERAFKDCTSLKSITIPDGVQSIGKYAFVNCEGLENVVIPGSVASLSYGVFGNCTSLKSLTIPEGVKSIDECAFDGCYDIESVNLPTSLTSIGDYAFYCCSSISAVNYAGTTEQWDEVTVGIGNTYLVGGKVHCIDGDVYPHGTCGDGVTWELKDGVLTISGTGEMEYTGAWYEYKDNVEKVVIGSGVTGVNTDAFTTCWYLSEFSVDADNESYCSIDGVIFTKDKTELLIYPKNKAAREYAIPDGVTSVREYAFRNCNNLRKVTIPASITDVSIYTFLDVASITDILVDEGNTELSSIDGVLFNKGKTILLAYPNGRTALSYRVPDGVLEIGNTAFWENMYLNSITLPDGLTTIGEKAFINSTDLRSVTIPASVSTIKLAAFCYCENLNIVNYGGTIQQWKAIDIEEHNDPLMTTLIHCADGDVPLKGTCGEDVTWTFAEGLLTISGTGRMDDFVTSPWQRISSEIQTIVIDDGITYIGENAFEFCRNVESISLPDGLESIGGFAFTHCSGIESITIPESVQSVGDGAFQGCTSLKSFVFPDSVTYIGNSSFYGCDGLESITLPKSDATIGEAAFNYCTSLKTVEIPESIYFEGNIFGWCTNLAAINVDENNPNYCSVDGVVFDKDMTTLLIYPSGRQTEEYAVPNGVTTIRTEAFFVCEHIKSVTIPETVQEIETQAFSGCENLVSIIVDGNNETYSSVDGILFTKDKTTLVLYPLGKDAVTYDIPDGVTTLGEYAFCDNRKLQSISIPVSVTTICDSAFEYNYSGRVLADIYYDGTLEQWGMVEGNDIYGVIVHCKDGNVNPSGICGANVTWSLVDGTLTISGYGDMFEAGGVDEWGWAKFADRIENIVIEDGVESISDFAFSNLANLKTASISASVERIGSIPFEGCESLETINVDEDNMDFCSVDGVLFNKDKTAIVAYPANKSETSFAIPDGVEKVGFGAFQGSENLQSITIPASVEEIDLLALDICKSLETIDVDAGNANYASVNGVLFNKDKTMLLNYPAGRTAQQYIIPDGIVTIKDHAFRGNDHIVSVVIPVSVTTIQDAAFRYVPSLTDVYYTGTLEQWENIAIEGEANEGLETATIHYEYEQTHVHSYAEVVTAPTCTEEGYTTYTCAECGDSYKDNYTNALGHDLVHHEGKAETCTEKGWKEYDTCSRCDYTTYEETAPTGHKYIAKVFAPTCTVKGYTTYTCTVCGGSYIDNYTDALGHERINHEAKAATCTEIGWDAYDTCSRCDYTSYKEIAALGHDISYSVTKAPTCTEKGTETGKCSRCDVTETRDIDALGHDLVHHDGKAATCTANGWAAYDTCNRCDYTTYKEIAATGHDYNAVVTEPTCTENGYTTHTCAACGDSYIDTYTDALGHDYGAWKQTKAPTCTEKGEETRTCARCNTTETREVASLGHNYKAVVTAPTCTAKGYTTHTCAACGDSYVDSYTDALGHNYGAWKQTKVPTCTANGTETRTCTRCNASETRDVASLGHDIKHHAAKAATCTEIGWAAYDTCSRCNYNTYKEIAALGHNYASGKCTRCGAADPNYIVAPELKITTSAGKPKISWNAVDGAVKYWVYRSTDGKTYNYYDSTTKTSYTNNSTTIGTTYYYKVKAVKANGAASDFSVSKGIQCKPAAPTLSINRSNGKPKLSWKAVSGATKYWIYRSTDGVNFKYFDSTTKTSYTNSGAASGTKYYYKVKAVAVVNGKNVTSANSSTKSLFTSLATPSVSITTSNGKPKLTWKAITGADKYYVYRSTDGKTFKYWDSTTKTTYVNSGATKNTKYYYKVRAVCASNSNANSAQSSTVSIKATK